MTQPASNPAESRLRERLEKHGSRGIVKVTSAEGAAVSRETASKLVPAS